jgi:hypothetical protein
VLLFSTAEPITSAALGSFVASPETSERGLVFGPRGIEEVFAFPLHVKAAKRYFEERGLGGEHDYTVI